MGGSAEGPAEVLVEPGEDVCRLCFSADIPISRDSKHPNQIDSETGLLRLEEISWQDVKHDGFSLQRKKLYSHAEAVKEAEKRDRKKSQKKGADVHYRLAGALIARVENINAIADDEGRPVFCVLATPIKEQPGHVEAQPGHAEIRVLSHIEQKHQFLKFRQRLRDALGRMLAPELIDAPAEA